MAAAFEHATDFPNELVASKVSWYWNVDDAHLEKRSAMIAVAVASGCLALVD